MAPRSNKDFCSFLQNSPTPFHAVATMATRLEGAGFHRLDESAAWQVQTGGRYYVVRNQSSLIAFRLAQTNAGNSGWLMAGAHTDSPCLKIKPQPELVRHGYLQLGVEVYGGALLNPWFDRDLSMAGRVHFVDDKGQLGTTLIDFKRAIAVIPSLAIHLDREVNSKRSINAQNDLPPLLLQVSDKTPSLRELLQQELKQQQPALTIRDVLDFELCLYDTQPAAIVGLNEDFIASARLDNLLSCYAGMEAMVASNGSANALLMCSDHEEVGSASAAGASGPFLQSVLRRLNDKLGGASHESFQQQMSQSLLVSVDNAHGIHPNFADKHDGKHGPLLNGGPVLKFNANQRYATSSETAARFRQLCAEVQVPVQAFVVRSDMGCGSTIGPLVSTELGIATVDIGVPTFAMHSIRELCGARDVQYLITALTRLYNA